MELIKELHLDTHTFGQELINEIIVVIDTFPINSTAQTAICYMCHRTRMFIIRTGYQLGTSSLWKH